MNQQFQHRVHWGLSRWLLLNELTMNFSMDPEAGNGIVDQGFKANVPCKYFVCRRLPSPLPWIFVTLTKGEEVSSSTKKNLPSSI